MRHLLTLFCLFLCLSLAACGGDDKTDTDAATDTAADTTDTVDDADTDTADTTDTTDMVDADVPGDVTDVPDFPTEPLRFTVIEPIEVRELVYMVGASSIVYPGVRVLCETALSDEPVPGVEVVWEFQFPVSRSDPMSLVTGANGRTEAFDMTLGADFSNFTTRIPVTPHRAGTDPTAQDRREIEASGMDVDVTFSADPIVGDGTSTYTMTVAVSRASGGTEILPDDMAIEVELVDNMGTPPLLFLGSLDLLREFPVDQMDPVINIDMQSSAAGAGQLRYFVRLKQLDSQRGSRLEMLDVVAP